MSRGKYSPNLPKKNSFAFNAYGKPPEPWNKEVAAQGVAYDEKTMFADYDDEGFDQYGYSCFYLNGQYAGLGFGVDRNGKTESDYLGMTDEEFEDFR